MQGDVAADPAGAAGGLRQRWAFDDGAGREGEVRYQQKVFHAPGREVVVQEIKVRGVVAANRGHHGFVCAVVDGIAEAGFLAFELIFEFADWTTEIDDLGVVSLPGKLW